MSKVTKFYPKDAANNPDNVIEQAIGEYESVLIIGYDHDGAIDVRASLNLNHAQVNFLIDRFKNDLISGEFGEEG